jgi:hypothetical protein
MLLLMLLLLFMMLTLLFCCIDVLAGVDALLVAAVAVDAVVTNRAAVVAAFDPIVDFVMEAAPTVGFAFAVVIDAAAVVGFVVVLIAAAVVAVVVVPATIEAAVVVPAAIAAVVVVAVVIGASVAAVVAVVVAVVIGAAVVVAVAFPILKFEFVARLSMCAAHMCRTRSQQKNFFRVSKVVLKGQEVKFFLVFRRKKTGDFCNETSLTVRWKIRNQIQLSFAQLVKSQCAAGDAFWRNRESPNKKIKNKNKKSGKD